MKKFLAYFLIFIISPFNIFSTKAAWESNKRYFRVTAYYSPLPNQKYYLKGNYLDEIKMNGKWIRWASGKKVFSGMLAGPSKYRFWTKIYLKWLWIWEIADRWGAIVEAGKRNFKYDRIDLWCGYGEEWLRRALYWWNRVIEWEIVSKKQKVTINYNKIPAPYWTTYKLKIQKKFFSRKKIKKQKTKFEIFLEKELEIFNSKLKNKKDTKRLQEILSDLWMYKWKIDWDYNKIVEIIKNYQLEKKLIKNKYERWAWYFWPKTRASLKKDYKKYLIKQEEKRKKEEALEKKLTEIKKEKLKIAENKIKNLAYLKKWDISADVRILQKILQKIWYFDYKDTAIFWEKTKLAIIKYQLDKKIIANTYEPWTWIFWPNTKKQLIKDYSYILFWEEIQKDKELTEFYQNKNSRS
jgi:hypothetical protein